MVFVVMSIFILGDMVSKRIFFGFIELCSVVVCIVWLKIFWRYKNVRKVFFSLVGNSGVCKIVELVFSEMYIKCVCWRVSEFGL